MGEAQRRNKAGDRVAPAAALAYVETASLATNLGIRLPRALFCFYVLFVRVIQKYPISAFVHAMIDSWVKIV
jgi:hypothetical protein